MSYRSVVLLMVLCVGGCVETSTQVCAGVICPAETVCVPELGACYSATATDVCRGEVDGAPCTGDDAREGVCDTGVCFSDLCGDGLLGFGESCDDGNRVGGDGCSANCLSDETCGNGVTDLEEECDCGDGTVALPGGCGGSNSSEPGAQCRTDCLAHCGDGELNAAEQCELEGEAVQTCVDVGFDHGHIGCGGLCQFDFGTCGYIGFQPDSSAPVGIGDTDLIESTNGQLLALGAGSIHILNGGVWSDIPTPRPELTNIWAADPNNIFASEYCAAVDCPGGIWRYDGAEWTLFQVSRASAIWGSGPNDVYVETASTLVYHWDGLEWTGENPGIIAQDVYGFGADDVWLTGNGGKVLRNQGAGWVDAGPTGTTLPFGVIHGTGPSDVWVASNATTYHWNGTTWTEFPLRLTSTGLIQNLWAGPDGKVFLNSSNGGFYALDGQGFSLLDTDCGVGPLAGGTSVRLSCSGLLWESKGTAWLDLEEPEGATKVVALDRDNIYLAAGGLHHYDGATWTELHDDAAALYSASSDDIYFAGGSGVFRSVGGSIESIAAPAHFMFELWVAPTGEIFTLGYKYLVGIFVSQRDSSGVWTSAMMSSNPDSYTWWVGISGLTADNLYTVGTDGFGVGHVAHFDGSDWSYVYEVGVALHDVWVANNGEVFVVGGNGLVLHLVDGVWTTPFLSAQLDLDKVHGSSHDNVFVTSSFGEIWQYDGTSWSEWRGNQSSYTDVSVTATSVYLAGPGAVDVLHRLD